MGKAGAKVTRAKAGAKVAAKAGAKAGAMSKAAIVVALATATETKKQDCKKALESLIEVATTEVKKTGKFTVPGLCTIKTRAKPATKAGKREVFGKVVMVKAKPATTVVKAYCAATLKKSI